MRDPFRQRHPDDPKTRQDIEDELTAANALKPFEEFPRFIYHPDATLSAGKSMSVTATLPNGESHTCEIRARQVNNAAEQSAAGADWHPTPKLALAEKEKRDQRSADGFIAKANAEAAEKQQEAFDKAVAEEVARQLAKNPKK